MKTKPRGEFIDSGIHWIGEIPKSWQVGKFRHIFTESKEVNGKLPVGEMLSVSGYRGVEQKEYSSDSLKRDQEDLETYRVVRPGQLAVNTMWLNYAGLGVSELTGHVSPAYRSYWINHRLNPRFAHYLMRSQIYVNAYTGYLTGVRPNSLQMSRENLMNWPILIPQMDEQVAIAEYLDRETAQIDELIDKQQQLIETLAERRKAVIAQAVTKSLDPTLPMKPSGVEWISEIPANWRIVKIGHLFGLIGSGTTPKADDIRFYEGEIPWVTTGELRESVIEQTAKQITQFALDEHSALRVFPAGSLVLALYGATIGRLGFLGVDATVNQACCVMTKPENVEPRFVYYALQAAKQRLMTFSVGGSQPNIGQDIVKQFRIALPPMQEQKAIIEYLDTLTDKNQKISEIALSMVETLKERRQALISAAVTGKIDVRGA